MIIIYRRSLERMTHHYHVLRVQLDLGLHKFVRDGEEDTRRMQRRLHIHICLLGGSGMIQFLDGPSLGTYGLAGVSFAGLALTELFDCLGKF